MKLMATAAAAQHPPELVSYCWLVLVILQHVAICTHFVDSGGRCCHFWGNCRPWTSCAFVDDKRLLHFYERYMHRVAPGTRASGSHLNGNSETEMPEIHLSTNGHVLECELEIVITFFVAHVNVIVIHRVRCQHWLRFSFFFRIVISHSNMSANFRITLCWCSVHRW